MKMKNKLLAMAFMLVATITMALTNPVSAKAESLEAEFTKEKKFEYYESGGSAVSETDIETAVIEAYNVDKENKHIFYIKNAHGDIIGKVNEQGNLLSSYAYNAFGEVVTFVDFTLEQQQSINRFLYAGEQYDETSGLYYLRARNYDAGAGRFTQEDTYLGDGRNLYAYVHSNPLKYVDPSGHSSEEQFDNDGDTNDWLDKATEGGFGQIVTSDVTLNTGLETYYRTMSPSDYDYLVMTGEIPATAETFISPSQSYANNYNGTTVKFKVDAGTTNELLNIGVSNNSGQVIQDYGVLPQVSSGWTTNNAYFKGERGQTNIGLGQGVALEIFNSHIISFSKE